MSDPALRCLPPSDTSCTRMEVSLEGRAGQVWPSYRGSYRELAGVYSAGHKVRQLTVLDWTGPVLTGDVLVTRRFNGSDR